MVVPTGSIPEPEKVFGKNQTVRFYPMSSEIDPIFCSIDLKSPFEVLVQS